MRQVRVEEAVGQVLGHDLTRIVPGQFKGAAFRKGHVIREEDIPLLLEMGKEHIFVFELGPGMLHEDEAALRLARAAAGEGLAWNEPREGKITLRAARTGLLEVDAEGLLEVNSIDQIVLATLPTHRPVREGEAVAGTRVVPLVVEEEKVRRAEEACARRGGLLRVLPFQRPRVGMITTGGEVYAGRIQDRFGPVVREKLAPFGVEVFRQVILPDDAAAIAGTVRELLAEGAGMIIATGGMSVDPDDVTPAGIRQAGAQVVAYGVPVLPGSMLLLAYLGDVPVLGLPGCVMYDRTTVFDLVLPRLLAGQRLTRADLVRLGHGGFCSECAECHFPACSFGRGGL